MGDASARNGTRITEDRCMLRAHTENLSLAARARLLVKYVMFPGTNWITRDKSRLVRFLLEGTQDRPIRTLDCGCGNAYFSYQAALRGSSCVGITIHAWEKQRCEEMRTFLGISQEQLTFRLATLAMLASESTEHGAYQQILLLDVIEHILDAPAAFRQLHQLCAEDGLIYITTPNRDWQGNADRIRVTRFEDGWHVRNGFTFQQLESLLEQAGFEAVDRLRFGSLGSTLVSWIQHHVFGQWIDPLTGLFFPLLKLVSLLLCPWRDPHTIFVMARKRRASQAG
jgi:2-polyprenyl-3-methyl-5-hydroxy-6-metoxy-1,4-benzoquinol methylase